MLYQNVISYKLIKIMCIFQFFIVILHNMLFKMKLNGNIGKQFFFRILNIAFW